MSERTRYRLPVFLCCFTQQRCRPAGRGCARGRTDSRRHGRGASPPAKPCFFVVEHHVAWTKWDLRPDGVVLHRPQTLVSSSRGTTSLGPIRLSSERAWCFTARQPLFLRRGAPRHWARLGFRRIRRGASRPPALVSSSWGTTSLGPVRLSADPAWCFTARKPLFLRRGAPRPRFPPSGQFREPAPGSRNSHLPQKTKNGGAGAAHAAPRRHFPFSPINR